MGIQVNSLLCAGEETANLEPTAIHGGPQPQRQEVLPRKVHRECRNISSSPPPHPYEGSDKGGKPSLIQLAHDPGNGE